MRHSSHWLRASEVENLQWRTSPCGICRLSLRVFIQFWRVKGALKVAAGAIWVRRCWQKWHLEQQTFLACKNLPLAVPTWYICFIFYSKNPPDFETFSPVQIHPSLIWGMLDLMCGDWGGAARDPELGVSGMWEWRLMGRTRSSAVHSQYCKFLPRFLWV